MCIVYTSPVFAMFMQSVIIQLFLYYFKIGVGVSLASKFASKLKIFRN